MSTSYTPGMNVQVSMRDFSPAGFAAGFPYIWVDGTVESLSAGSRGTTDVSVLLADGTYHSERVGKRGGNPRLRPA